MKRSSSLVTHHYSVEIKVRTNAKEYGFLLFGRNLSNK